MSEIRSINTRVATLSDLILDSVGTDENKLMGELSRWAEDGMAVGFFRDHVVDFDVVDILRYKSLSALAHTLPECLMLDDGTWLVREIDIAKEFWRDLGDDYEKCRNTL